jgi:hypothetical protein
VKGRAKFSKLQEIPNMACCLELPPSKQLLPLRSG